VKEQAREGEAGRVGRSPNAPRVNLSVAAAK